MKKIKETASELKSRWQGNTPSFWKKVQRIGIIAGSIGGVIVASPIALPVALVTLSGYLLLAGSVTATLAQLTVEK
jgi:lipopolysaccharide/colanic/teichoic acid biosynthesis glycosyltransferase